MTQNKTSGKVRFIKPPNKLKMKVGAGGLDEKLLEGAQKFIESSELDFAVYAQDFLSQLSEAVKRARLTDNGFQDVRQEIIKPVMQLKANGGMFQYQLVSDVADIALQFLESIDDLDEDALTVITAHENTVKVIIASKLKGAGGKEGYALIKELDQACRRYFSRHKAKK